MRTKEILRKLQEQYPDKNIVRIPQDKPREIICEIEPASEHPDRSVAIAVIDRSLPHKHLISTETYEILQGGLVLTIDGQDRVLWKGAKMEVPPGKVHEALGFSTWVKVVSTPGWKPEDHISEKI